MMFGQKVVATTASTRGGGVSTVVPAICLSFRSSRTSSHYRGGAVRSRNRRLTSSFCCHRKGSTLLPLYGEPISKNSHKYNSNKFSPFPVRYAFQRRSSQIGTGNRMNGGFLSSRRRDYTTTVGSNETTTEPTSSIEMASAPPVASTSMGDDECRSTLIETAAEEGCSATLRYAQRCKADESSLSSSVTSIVTASEQLLHATNATNLLLDQILEIRNKKVGHSKTVTAGLTVGNATSCRDSRKKCVQELHRAFLSLVQSLLERMDSIRDGSNSEREIQMDKGHPNSEDGEEVLLLMDLVVKLSYRAHQLQFWFHRPLYKRIAVAFAKYQKKNQKLKRTDNTRGFAGDDSDGGNTVLTKQPRRSVGTTKRRSRKRQHRGRQQQQNTLNYVLRSRVNWIWTIYRWSNEESKSDDKNTNVTDKPSHDNQMQNPVSQHDIEWFFRDIFITLARNGEWSDLSYMLQGVLLSSSVSRDQDLIICGHSTGGIDSLLNKEGEANQMLFLDERLVVEILISMQRQGIFPSIWKSENVNSVEVSAATLSTKGEKSSSKIDIELETDILGIILLMEPSIWRIFEYDTGASDSRNDHIFEIDDDEGDGLDTSARDNTVSLTTDLRRNHQASLRDAIEALLETESSYGVFNDTREDDIDFDDLDDVQNDDDEGTSKAKYFDLLDDLLIDLLQDLNSRDNNDTTGVIVSISKSPNEVMGENGTGRNRILQNSSSQRRYKHSVGTKPWIRTGHEMPSLSMSSVKSSSGRQSSDEYDWEYLCDESPSSNGDSTFWKDDFDEDKLLYLREHYHDQIPDLCSLLYEHNGRRPLRYRPSFEREILDQLGQSYDDEDYEDEFGDEDV